ncbi:hypothetical protein [Streptomyces sp. NPDC093109]|uniref:hypothetical protein n=1 Tax=Streptomyces sp. NPDC093109 TaxID=3154977 RepID=UPI00344BE4E5
MNDGVRHGVIVDRRPTGGGPRGTVGAFVVQDEDDGHYYTFDYTHIVTEGFRTIRTGERVRFHVADDHPGQAEFVIRLDQPDPEEYYR